MSTGNAGVNNIFMSNQEKNFKLLLVQMGLKTFSMVLFSTLYTSVLPEFWEKRDRILHSFRILLQSKTLWKSVSKAGQSPEPSGVWHISEGQAAPSSLSTLLLLKLPHQHQPCLLPSLWNQDLSWGLSSIFPISWFVVRLWLILISQTASLGFWNKTFGLKIFF